MHLTPSILTGAASLLLVAAAGVAVEAPGDRQIHLSQVMPGQEARIVPAGFKSECSPGPSRVSDMVTTPDGFRKSMRNPERRQQFYFARAMYSGGWRGGYFGRRGGDYLGDRGPSWSIDYPSADHHMMLVARRLSNLDACEWGQPISFADPDLRLFPFVYSLEWGYASLSDAEVSGLRDYLLAGGMLMIDDFWGTREWSNMERELRRVLPEYEIVDVPRDHLLFRAYYQIEGDIVQVPNNGNGMAVGAGYPNARTSEEDGYEPYIRGIFDDEGRLMIVIYANTDLGDALEWAENPYYPVEFSTFASQIFLNTIMYAMTQ